MGIVLYPTKFPLHPTEEILEEYVFDRLPEELTAPIEEHLLICPICQDAIVDTDRFVSDLTLAAGYPPYLHPLSRIFGVGGLRQLLLSPFWRSSWPPDMFRICRRRWR